MITVKIESLLKSFLFFAFLLLHSSSNLHAASPAPTSLMKEVLTHPAVVASGVTSSVVFIYVFTTFCAAGSEIVMPDGKVVKPKNCADMFKNKFHNAIKIWKRHFHTEDKKFVVFCTAAMCILFLIWETVFGSMCVLKKWLPARRNRIEVERQCEQEVAAARAATAALEERLGARGFLGELN